MFQARERESKLLLWDIRVDQGFAQSAPLPRSPSSLLSRLALLFISHQQKESELDAGTMDGEGDTSNGAGYVDDGRRNRLPSFTEVLARKTRPPVDLFMF